MSSFIARYSTTDLTVLPTSALFQDLQFKVAAIFNALNEPKGVGAREREAWVKAEKGLYKPEWQRMRERVACK